MCATHPPKDPSTRQDPLKMGIFFKKIRQKSVRETSTMRQEAKNCAKSGCF